MRGQISFDLIFAILIFATVIGSLQNFAEITNQDFAIASVHLQQKAILQDLVITANELLTLNDGIASIEYKIPQIHAGIFGNVECTISVSDTTKKEITITSKVGDETVTEKITIGNEISALIWPLSNASCGSTIKLEVSP